MNGFLLFLLSFSATCSGFVFLAFAFVIYYQFICVRDRKIIKLKRNPLELPEGIEEGVETAEWANCIIDQIFYAAGGLKLVELLHAAFITSMEQKSSLIANSELRLLIEGLAVRDFRLGKHLPRLNNILTKVLSAGDFALVFDVEFERGSMVTELGAKMGFGFQDVAAKIVASRFVGKTVIKFEVSPNPRVSLLATSVPEFRLLVSYGKTPMLRLSSLIELVVQSLFKSRLLYPQYQILILNLSAEKFESLAFISPANTTQSILRIGSVKADIRNDILKECNVLQLSIHVGLQKYKSSNLNWPFLSKKLTWKLAQTFNLLPERETATELSIRLLNKKKILGTEILGGIIISLATIPVDSHETLKITLGEGIDLEMEVFHAKIAQSGFVDREWIFWNEAPPLPVKEEDQDEDVEPNLDRINLSTILFALQKLLSGEPPSLDEEGLLNIENYKNSAEVFDEEVEHERKAMNAVEVFYHSAVDYLQNKCTLVSFKSVSQLMNVKELKRQSSSPHLTIIPSRHKLILLMLLSEVSYDNLHQVICYNRKLFEDLLEEVEDKFLYFSLSTLLHLEPHNGLHKNSTELLKANNLLSMLPCHSCFVLKAAIIELNNNQISIEVKRHLTKCKAFGVIGGRNFVIEAFGDFIYWHYLDESLFVHNIMDLNTIDELVYCANFEPFFRTGGRRKTEINQTLRLIGNEREFNFEGEDLSEIFFYLQSHFVRAKKIPLVSALLDSNQRLLLDHDFLLSDCPLDLFLLLPNREFIFEPQIRTVILKKEVVEKGNEEAYSFEGSFIYRGLVRGEFTIKRGVLLFEGLQNRYKQVKLIIPLKAIIKSSLDSRMFLGKGIQLYFKVQKTIEELYIFSLSKERSQVVMKISAFSL